MQTVKIVSKTLAVVCIAIFFSLTWYGYKQNGIERLQAVEENKPTLPNFEHDSNQAFLDDVKIKKIYKDKTDKFCYGQVTIHSWKRKGTVQYHLEMLPSYRNKKEFVDTLGHEMVHLYQMANVGDTGNHNKLFYSFRPKLNAIGLDL